MHTARHWFDFTDHDRMRFISYTRVVESGCIEWTGRLNRGGYGCISYRGAHWFAHRAAWVMAFGAIPVGLCVLHKCNNRKCVNSEHLKVGTNDDNVQDRIAAGSDHYERRNWFRGKRGPVAALSGENHFSHRHPELVRRGEKHHMAKLTDAQVIQIRGLAVERNWDTYNALAERFDVSPITIMKIVRHETWRHVA